MADQEAVALDLPGFFRPDDHHLITHFLHPKIAGEPYDRRFIIHEADVYSAVPADLVVGRDPASGTDHADGKKSTAVWYFFCPARYKNGRGRSAGRRQRAVGTVTAGEGFWKSEGRPKDVLDLHDRRVGLMQRLSYGVKTSPATFSRLGWCMLEFSLDQEDGAGGCGLVLCKVYRSPRAQASMPASPSCSGSKRKAADDDSAAPPSVRMQKMATNFDDQLLQEFERELFRDGEDLTAPLTGVDVPQYQMTNMMADMLHGAPPCASIAAPEQDPEFVETVDGLCSDHEFILRLAAGERMNGMLGPSMLTRECLEPFLSTERDAYIDDYWSPRQSSSFGSFIMSMAEPN